MAEKLTNTGLVEFARSKIGTPYVYGCKQIRGKEQALTLSHYKQLKAQYGTACVWESDIIKVGEICCDCSGLISWYTGKIYGSAQYKSRAAEVHGINTIKTAPIGAAVWLKGHIGIYSGLKNGVPYYIAEDGSAYGCREVPLSKNKFTHWFKISDICYEDENETEDKDVIETIKININGKDYNMKRILKDGRNFICIADMKQAGFDVGYNEKTKVPSISNRLKELPLNVDGRDTSIETVNIDGFNFCPIRSMAEAVGSFDVTGYKEGTVYVSSK